MNEDECKIVEKQQQSAGMCDQALKLNGKHEKSIKGNRNQ